MHYIIFDLEFNQDHSSLNSDGTKPSHQLFEIIQIGAIKFDSNYHTVATFNHYIKPSFYSQINPLVNELTGITMDQLLSEKPFPDVFNDFVEFLGDGEIIFCIWGMMDMKVIFKNIEYHNLNSGCLPIMYINLQPYVSIFLNYPRNKLFNLENAVETLGILKPFDFHNALYDAFYTAEIMKKLQHLNLQPNRYDPNFVRPRSRQPKKIVDFEMLLKQFEKMYTRELSKEEQEMIILAYKMGRTNQFIKDNSNHL